MENNKIKQILLVAEIVSESDIDEAIKLSAKEKRDLQEILIERDLISDEHLGQLIADDLGHEFVDLQKKPIPEKALEIIQNTKKISQQDILCYLAAFGAISFRAYLEWYTRDLSSLTPEENKRNIVQVILKYIDSTETV